MPKRFSSKRASRGRSRSSMRMSLRPTQSVVTRLVDFGQVLCSSGGVLSAMIDSDPSTFSTGEWADFKAVYGQVRLIGSRITIMVGQDGKTLNVRPVAVGATLSNSSAPGGYVATLDNVRSLYWTPSQDTSAKGRKLEFRQKNLEFADVSTPNPGGFAGCPGGFGMYGDGLGNALHVLNYMIESFVEFRNRT